MKQIGDIKIVQEDFEVEYELLSISEPKNMFVSTEKSSCLSEIESRISDNEEIIDQLNSEIDRLTNKADSIDYTIAVASGILTGMIDSFFVGEFNFSELKADANKHVNKFIEGYAKLRGYEDNGRGLKGAIEFLENKFPVDQDNVWKESGISSTKLHHLEDLAHHPTILGLVASIAVAFFRTAIFIDKDGQWHFVLLETSKKDIIKMWAPIIISGVLRWLVHIAESKYVEENSKELPKPIHKLVVALSYSPAILKVLKVVDNWFGHLVSDMGGSKNTPGGGMGIPGIFISLLKEISSLPFLKNTSLPRFVSDLYSKGKWDLRSELAIMEYVGKQSVPVILNELIVRTFYFVRHLINEYKTNDGWDGINWDNVMPWRNRTITRMITIASGTFVAVDAADAAIRASLKSGGEPSTFFANMVLRINFVGIGRFAIAIGTDAYMGYKCNKLRDERLRRQSELILLKEARLFYKEADMWVAAKDASEAIDKMEATSSFSIRYMLESLMDIEKNLHSMTQNTSGIMKNNQSLLNDISNIIKYGK